MRGLFKGTPSGAFLKLAYSTGILPIKKYGTQSALNNFREHTMVSPRQMAEYVGFSETEVKNLCEAHDLSFKGLRQLIVDMLGGSGCSIDVESFQNDITSFYSTDDVIKAVNKSEALLQATLAMDEKTVAQMIQEVHMQNVSSLVYNNEISLSSVIALAYYSACKDYTLIREMPTGSRFADMVFLPKRSSLNPALILELKWDKTARGAISQIKKKYVSALQEYKGNILLVGISYEKKSKKHQCRIKKYEIQLLEGL